jgi:dienelactone hydrolase
MMAQMRPRLAYEGGDVATWQRRLRRKLRDLLGYETGPKTALCIEQRSFGERREQVQQQVSSHGCHDAAMQALLLGKTLIGARVYDVERGIDYLAGRGDADMGRIGVMGNSGGGTITIYAAALLSRLAFAMPSCSFCTFYGSIGSIYHCADNYVPGILKVADMADVLGLLAPRPVVVVAGKEDTIFPIDGVRAAFAQLQRIYAAAGAGDACYLVVGQGGHRFYAADAWPVMLDIIEGETHGDHRTGIHEAYPVSGCRSLVGRE